MFFELNGMFRFRISGVSGGKKPWQCWNCRQVNVAVLLFSDDGN